MKQSPIQDLHRQAGHTMGQRYDWEVPITTLGLEKEYRAVRQSVGLTDFSFLQKFRFSSEDAIFMLDDLLPANIANIRFGRIIHTFLSDEDGQILSDVYVVNNDEEILLFCESLTDDATVETILQSANPDQIEMENLTENHAVFSIDGPRAWAVAKEIFSADVLGMPYLSVEPYDLDEGTVTVMRTGKTGEFGYLVMVPSDAAESLWKSLLQLTHAEGGIVCGLDVHNLLRLDGRFFNINAEGLRVKDPLKIGLQWMIDFEKETFLGKTPLFDRRNRGLTEKCIVVKAIQPGHFLSDGDTIHVDNKPMGTVVTQGFSFTLDRQIAMVSMDVDYAYADVPMSAATSSGPVDLLSISMPPFIPKSLTIKLDEM